MAADAVPRSMERVDVRGEICPRPALIVRRRLAALDADEELRVLGDYPPAKENLRRTCDKHGFEVEDVGDGDEEFELAVRVTDEASIPER